jgi:serine protease
MKMKRLISILAIVAILFAFGVIPASADQGGLKEIRQPEIVKAKWVPDEILVKFKGDVEHFRVVKVPEGQVLEKVKEYLKRSDVDYAEPNYYAYAFWVPNDPYYSYQWDLDNSGYGGIQMEQAWGIQTGSASVVVAVVDTGVAYENYSTRGKKYYLAPDLANTVFVPGYDYVENDTHPNDDNSHGTHVTGTIAQSTNNSIGVAGVAFNTAIMPVKVLNKNGSGTYANVAKGIIWATDHGADVINLSLGGASPSSTLEDAVKYAYEHGVTVIAAAGNDGSSQVSYPAAYDNYVIAVGATRYDETLAYYSNYGTSLDLVAPGGDLNVDQNKDGYGDGVLQNTFNPNTKNTGDFGYWFFQGTSMAAPHVSGVAALLLAQGNAATPDEVRAALQETAKDLGVSGRDDTYGWGLVDAYAALQWSAGPNKSPVANAGPDQTVSDTDSTGAEMVTLDGSASYDSDGTISSYNWTEGATLLGVGKIISHNFAVGTHTVTLTVTDDKGASASDECIITVVANQVPVANAGPDRAAYVGDTVTFNGSGSSDPDGYIVSYSWNFGDGTSGGGVTATHVYSSAGNYTVTLTVMDNGSLTGQDTAIVSISEAPAAPTAWRNIDLSKQSTPKWWKVTTIVTVTENNASGLAIAGATVYGNWSGAYSKTVSGTTDNGGKVSFTTGSIKKSGIVTFTVTKIVKNGQEYVLSGEASDSING